MARYYVNDRAQTDSGDHEVHRSGCVWLPKVKSKTYVGDHATCSPAVTAAKKIYRNSNGCATCSPRCHTT